MCRLKAAIPVFACLLLFSAGKQGLAQTRMDEFDRALAAATQLHEAGDIEGAIRGYQAILAQRPERVDVRSNLGAAFARLGRYEDAIAEYKRALVIDPRHQTIRFNLALAYYKAALFAEAATELNSFIATQPETRPERWSAILLLADCQIRLGDYKKVIDLLSPLEAAHGSDRAFAYLLGSALISDNQVARGQVLIDRVFGGEDSAEARLLIGSILLLADDGAGAIKEFENALKLNEKLPSLYSWYGRALMRIRDIEKAIEAFKTELVINPNDFDANLYLGVLFKRDKRYDEALAYLRRAAQVRPRDSYVRYHLGALFLATGKPDDAQRLLAEVVKEWPEFIEARVVLASTYYRLNRKADGDRERAMIEKLEAQQQSRPPDAPGIGGDKKLEPSTAPKPPIRQP
jgi:tetratricopeptide (TPR) repeat protein